MQKSGRYIGTFCCFPELSSLLALPCNKYRYSWEVVCMMDMGKGDIEGWNLGTAKKTFVIILDDAILSHLFYNSYCFFVLLLSFQYLRIIKCHVILSIFHSAMHFYYALLHMSATFQSHLSHISVTSQPHISHISATSQSHLSHNSVTTQPHLNHISATS